MPAAMWWRAALAVGCALLILVPVTACSGDGGSATSRSSAPSSPPPDPVHDDVEADGAVVPPIAKATDLVTRFAAVWVRDDLRPHEWWAAIEPLCERGFALRLRSTGRPTSPRLTVTGKPTLAVTPAAKPGTVVATPNPSGVDAVYHVPVGSSTLVVDVGLLNGEWLVVGVDLRRAVT